MKRKILNEAFKDVASYKMVLLLDLIVVAVSFFFVSVLYNGIVLFITKIDVWFPFLIIWILIHLIFFLIFGTYRSILRYAAVVDFIKLFSASISSLFLVILIQFIGVKMEILPFVRKATIVFSWALSLIGLFSLRLSIRFLYEEFKQSRIGVLRTVVYGVDDGGVLLMRSIRFQSKKRFNVLGFIVNKKEEKYIGKKIVGLPVYEYNDKLVSRLVSKNIDSIIVLQKNINDLGKCPNWIDQFLSANIKIFTIPEIKELGTSPIDYKKIRSIEVEDLLQREQININFQEIFTYIEGKRILITGAAGSIGSEIVRWLTKFNPYKLILIDQAETPLHDLSLELQENWRNLDVEIIVADITNHEKMDSVFKTKQPQIVFHAAAYKHVPMMEDNACEAIQNNVVGTQILADNSVKYGVSKFVMVSTDKAVNPTNVMGCSKRLCEIYVQSLDSKLKQNGKESTRFITTRFGNVLGSNGSVVPLFRKQIEEGGPVTVTHPDIVRYFMTIPEACQLVLEAGIMGNGGEIYVFDMGNPVKIVDLAKQMIKLSGRNDVKIAFTGLRHGEKLYEEVLGMGEIVKPTNNDKVKIAKVLEYDYDEVKKDFEKLVELSYKFNDIDVVAQMKNIVPEFKSMNSIYEKLDCKM